MAAASCSIHPHVFNNEGQKVESNLFKEILKLTNNDRTLTKDLYFKVATNKDFIAKILDKADFDENGEITLSSFLKLSKINIKDSKVLNYLNKEIKSGEYSYQQAINKLQDFNKNSQWKDKYMATIQKVGDNYRLSVVKRSSSEERKLNTTIGNEFIQNRLINLLASYGVAVDFLSDNSESSRYSTENAVQSADGLYHLIRIAQGENISKTLAEEAGHFAVGAMGDNPLIERLLNTLTPEVQRSILGDEEYTSKFLGKNARREVAGVLVGRALHGGIDKRSAWGNLAHKIAVAAKKLFANFRSADVRDMMMAKIKAEEIADKIAKGFVSGNETFNLENALQHEETLYDAEYSPNVRVFKQASNILRAAIDKLKSLNTSLAADFEEALAAAQLAGNLADNTGHLNALADINALEGLAELITRLNDLMVDTIPSRLERVDVTSNWALTSEIVHNASELRKIHETLQTCYLVYECINGYLGKGADSKLIGDLSYIQRLDPFTGQKVVSNLYQLQDSLGSFVLESRDNLFDQLRKKEFTLYLRFLEQTLGRTYVQMAAKAIFKPKNWNTAGKHIIEFVKAKKVPISFLLKELEEDTSLFDRWFGSMSNSDVINQICDRAVKQANKNADEVVNQHWDRLKEMQEKAKHLHIDTTKFYERDESGKLTGDFISPLRYSLWEERHKQIRQRAKEKFMEAHKLPDGTYDFANQPDLIRGLEFEAFIEAEGDKDPVTGESLKNWNDIHSVLNEETQKYEPNPDYNYGEYKNKDYDALSTEEKQLLSELMELKREIDALADNKMPTTRAPQFRGRFMNRVKNRGSRLNPKLYAKGIKDWAKETFCEDALDTDFGSIYDYNKKEDMLFEDDLAYEKGKIDRIPLYGINKLQDMDQLSTDIFHSLLCYSSMACNYAGLSTVVDLLEVGRSVLDERKVKTKGGSKIPERLSLSNKSRTYNRYTTYLDMQVYGISQPKLVIGKHIVVNKVVGFLSGIAAKTYLGGNVAGGLVNLGTGVNEIFKEALCGQYFDLKDWTFAHGYYWYHLPENLWEMGKQDKENKMSLFMKKMNVQNQNKKDQKDFYTDMWRVTNIIYNELLMAPYSTGDHYMQSIAFLALAHKTKLISESGETRNLWEALEVTKIGNTNKKTLQYKNGEAYFKSKQDREDYMFIKDLLQSITDTLNNASPITGISFNFTTEQEDWLNKKGYHSMIEGIKNLYTSNPKVAAEEGSKVIKLLNEDMALLKWGIEDESAFMDKAREINDRMHGIYNQMDKTAFHGTIAGNALLSMRGYALGMIQRRFGNSKYSIALGEDTEGSLTTVAKVLAASTTDRWGFWKALGTIFMPFGKRAKQRMLDAGFSASQYANLRRNFGDLLLIAVFALLRALSAMPDDDDSKELNEKYKNMRKNLKERGLSNVAIYRTIKAEKEADFERKQDAKRGLGLLNYFATRLFREQSAYNVVNLFNDERVVIVEEWSNVSSLTPTAASVVIDYGRLLFHMYGDIVYDYNVDDPEFYEMLKDQGYSSEEIKEIRKTRKEEEKNQPGAKFFYKQSVRGLYEKGDPKAKYDFIRMLPYLKNWKVWNTPYEAIKSYQYGRKTR